MRFVPQRYVQDRNGVDKPRRRSGRKQWIMARSLCFYRVFDLSDVSPSRRDKALQLQIKQWSPFDGYGDYIVWLGARAQVWIWPYSLQKEQQSNSRQENLSVLPETVLREKSKSGLQLLQCCEGVEAQFWQNGLLKASHWWPQLPEKQVWQRFLRHNNLPLQTLPVAKQQKLLDREWGKPRRRVSTFGSESLWVGLLFSCSIIMLSFQIVETWRWHQALNHVGSVTERLNNNASAILDARNKAIVDRQAVERLLGLKPSLSQLELFVKVAETLPLPNARITEWEYQTGDLRFSIITTNPDPKIYVEMFQARPEFREVKAERGERPDQIKLHMKPAAIPHWLK